MSDANTTDNPSVTGIAPASVISGSGPATNGAASPERQGFDFVRHEEVQKMRQAGIWTFLGDRFGNLEVRLRPFYEEPVVVKKEAAEQAIRMQLGLSDDDPLPGEKGIEVNKAAVNMAITGARGDVRGTAAMLQLARKHGIAVADGWITFSGHEEAEAVRDLFGLMVNTSMHLLTTLVRASRGLHRVKDEEVSRVGEAFVYGRHVKVDWAD